MRIQLMTPRKLPFFISESYHFGFMLKINGNFATDGVTVYQYKVSVFCPQPAINFTPCQKTAPMSIQTQMELHLHSR